MILQTFKDETLHEDDDAGIFALIGTTLVDFAPTGATNEDGAKVYSWNARLHNGEGDCVGNGVDTLTRCFRKSVIASR